MVKSCVLKKLLLFFVLGSTFTNIYGQEANKMDWFSDAKLGIFIHWGIYSLGNTSESWAFHNKRISHSDYMAQADSFSAANYNPGQWAKIIKSSGARYSVITSKHHDGIALWNTKQNKLSTIHKTPAKRDLLTPFVEALKSNNIKVGIYYSLIDWTHPDYPGFLRDSSRYKVQEHPELWQRFIKFCHDQINELSAQFNPDLFWFDGDWEHSAEEWQASTIKENILKHNPNAIINGRLQGFGDYDTPEQNFPVTRPNLKYWELCMTMNDSWGYQKKDNNYKSPYEIITIFADAISMGGNLLLDITPNQNGTIPYEQIKTLEEIGQWTNKHQEAIFGTLGGMPQGHFYGPSTISKDSCKLFLFVPAKISGDIVIKGLDNGIKSIGIVGNNAVLKHRVVGKISWSQVPGLIYISIPESCQDKYMTVIKLELDKPIKLYRGKGGFN